MNATGLGVTPELLTGAASAIDAAVRAGDLGCPPTPAGGPDYGHPGAADAVARFGSAIGEATRMLLAGASRTSTGLRAGADAYLAYERSASAGLSAQESGLAGLMGVPAERSGGLSPEQAGLAGLMGVPAERSGG